MGSRRRSRTPPGQSLQETKQSLYISKQLVSFGRYPTHRPKGLRVCEGSLTLNNLMECWAQPEGFSRLDVLNAVRKHMFHEGGQELRFELTQEGQDKVIKVKPRRGAGRPLDEERGSERRQRSRVSTPLSTPLSTPRSTPLSTPRSTRDKLNASLDDIIHEENRGDQSAPPGSSREPFATFSRPSLQRKMDQMGLTPQTKHLRRPPMSDRGGRHRGGRDDAMDRAPERVVPKKPPIPTPREVAQSKAAPPRPDTVQDLIDIGMNPDEPSESSEEIAASAPEPGNPDAAEMDLPDGPPGPHWEVYDDSGTTWWFYDGPKGKFACLGPGQEVQPITQDT
ncbi:unnamed protein product [Effrenium voratum]|uniref:Uncharacterized protein n=2 Tax=Effrenium voratum TaxID=2562239 RepID=A0AA36NLK7_9DINO|nr:unnamed protein product [Effrenium voratum]CAJ1442911.1 unnamed protein product [Effrenium voratum]